jgi:hypothetical protein
MARAHNLYARVDEPTAEAMETFRREHSLTMSAAAGELIERGLQAVADEDSVRALQAELLAARKDLAASEEQLWEARARAAALAGVEGQLRAVVAQCEKCQAPWTIRDIFFIRICPRCRAVIDPFRKESDTEGPARAAILGGIAGLVFGLAAGSGPREGTGS